MDGDLLGLGGALKVVARECDQLLGRGLQPALFVICIELFNAEDVGVAEGTILELGSKEAIDLILQLLDIVSIHLGFAALGGDLEGDCNGLLRGVDLVSADLEHAAFIELHIAIDDDLATLLILGFGLLAGNALFGRSLRGALCFRFRLCLCLGANDYLLLDRWRHLVDQSLLSSYNFYMVIYGYVQWLCTMI